MRAALSLSNSFLAPPSPVDGLALEEAMREKPDAGGAFRPTPAAAVDLSRPLLVKSDGACELLGLSPRTLWTLTNGGDLPAVRVFSAVRYDRRALLRYIGADGTADALTRAHLAAGDDLLHVGPAAELLGVSTRLLWNLTNDDDVPKDRRLRCCRLGRSVRYLRRHLVAFCDKGGTS